MNRFFCSVAEPKISLHCENFSDFSIALGRSLHDLRYLPSIRYPLWYFVIHIRNSLLVCGTSLLIFGIRKSSFICFIQSFFSNNSFLCVTNNESNANVQ